MKYSIIRNIASLMKLNSFKREWARNNRHNYTFPINRFPIECVEVGKETYGELNVVTFSNESKLVIGNYVSISPNVSFLLDVEHHIDHISTYPFRVKTLKKQKAESFSKGNIIVGDDAWIGYGAIILSGVRIGQGAVVAAGSVVTKDVPPYTIVGGCPAKQIRKRFRDEIIENALQLDYSQLTKELICKHESELYSKVDNVDQVQWMPKKN